jgi:hypothetical protein
VAVIISLVSCRSPITETPEPGPVSTPEPTATIDYSLELPFEGVWTSKDGSVLILTADRFYWKFLQGQENDVVTENLAKILDYDLEAGHMQIYVDAVLIDTRPGGFDHTQRNLVSRIEGDNLWIAFSDETYSEWFEELQFIRY